MFMSAVSKKRTDLSVSEKLRLIDSYDKLNLSSLSQRKAAAKLGMPQSSLSKLLKSRETLIKNTGGTSESRKRKRKGKSHAVDEALLIWFKQACALNIHINRSILLQKANDFGEKLKEEFRASDGWLSRWKERNGIVYKKLLGEKQESGSSVADNWLRTFWQTISSTYSSEDIFFTDETGLYYRTALDHRQKIIKDRITVILTCNITGTIKMKPLVISKSKSPRCFRGVKRLPVEYASNSNARLTPAVFENYLSNWNRRLDKHKKKIALILDNSPAHPKLYFKNIELVFLPPNTRLLFQACYQEIIKTFKTCYRSGMKRRIIQSVDDGAGTSSNIKWLSVLDTLHMITNTWNNVSETCIISCFRKSGLLFLDGFQQSQDTFKVQNSESLRKQEFNDRMYIDRDYQVSTALADEEIAQSVIDSQTTEEGNEENDSEPEQNLVSPTLKVLIDKEITHSQPKGERDEENHNVAGGTPLSKWQATEAVAILRRAPEEGDAPDNDYRLLYSIENSVSRLCRDNSKQDADKPSTKSVFKTDFPQENKDVTQAISNDFISKKAESSEDAKLIDAILESKCDVKSSHESESAAMKPSVETNLEESVLDISNKPVISETLSLDMKKENTDFSDKMEKKDISPSKVKKSLSVPQEISKVQGEVQPSLSDTVSDSNKGISEEAMEGTNLDDSCDKQSEEKIGALQADEDSQKSTDSERKRQHDVESLSDAEGSQPLKRTRLDMVIGKLGERISIPPEVVESESFEYDDSNQGDSESVEKQSEEISASASEDEDDRTSISSSKTLRLTNKDLEALVRSKVKAYMARQQSAELRALQTRVDELLQAQEEWRKKTKELEHQVLDLTVLQQRLEKRKAHTAALRSITTRNFGIQVNEEKLKSNTPQKSTPKTPPTTNSTLLPASNLVVWTAPPYGQPGMSPTNTAVSTANKVTTVTIGQNLGSRNTSVAQLLSHTARMPTASTSVTTTKPTPVPISNSATKAQSAVAVPAGPARSLLDQSGTASNLSKVTGAVTHPTSLVLVNASTGLPVVSKGAATTTILTAPVGSTPSPSNGIKVIDLTMEDDPNIVRQPGKQVVVSSGPVRNMVPQQVVRQIAPMSQHLSGTSTILLSSPAGTQIMGTQGMPRTPGMYQVVTIPNAQNLRPGSLVTVLPGQTNVVRQPAPAVTTTNAVRPQPPPLLTQGPSSMTIMRPAQVIGVSSAVRPTIVSQPTTTAQMLLTGAALSSGSTAAVQQDTSPTLSSSKLTKVAPRLHPAPLPPAVTRNIPGERKPPPPQPGLKISRVKQGIVLSWNMYLPDDGTEVSSYQLYAYQETSAPPQSSLWKKVGDVKALPLPMACTLTQFQEGNKYHFAVRAVDIHGRTGLFSEPAFIFLNKGS